MSGSKTLKRLLGEFSFVSIVGDGNCLFRSLSYATTGNQNSHGAIRQRICDYLLTPNLPKNLRLALTGINLESYVAAMRQNAVYGTLIELLAFSHLERRPVIVYYTNDAGQYLSEVYNPHYRSPVIYFHLSSDHYRVLASSANRKNKRINQHKSKPKAKPATQAVSEPSNTVSNPVSNPVSEPPTQAVSSPSPFIKTVGSTNSLSTLSSSTESAVEQADPVDPTLSKITEVLRLNTKIVEYYRKGIVPADQTIADLEKLVEKLTAELNIVSKPDLDVSVSRSRSDEALARLFEEEDILSSEIDIVQKEYSASKADADKSQLQERLIVLNSDLDLVRAKIISLGGSLTMDQLGGSEQSIEDKITYLYKKSYAHYKNIYLDLALVRSDEDEDLN